MLILLQCAKFKLDLNQDVLIVEQDNRACSFDKNTQSTLNINITQNKLIAQIIHPYVVNNFVEHYIYPKTQPEKDIFKGSKKNSSVIKLITTIMDVDSSFYYIDSRQAKIFINTQLMIIGAFAIMIFIAVCCLCCLFKWIKHKKLVRIIQENA